MAAARAEQSRAFAALVAAGILLSRLAGLVRERIFAHYFGSSLAAGAFRAALRIPNFLQNLFGEGVLSASFVPVYAKLRAEGDDATAARVAGVVGSLLAVFVTVLVAAGVLATPWIVDVVAPGFHGEARALTTTLVRILFPGIGLLVLSAWCLGILNSHQRFFLPYAAPVAWNAAMIVAMIAGAARGARTDALAVWLAWGAVAGCALQLLVQLPAVLRLARGVRPGLDLALPPVREVLRNVAPVVVGRGVVQLSAYVDGFLASFLGTGAVATLGYVQILALLPVSLFGMSVAAVELTQMSSTLGTDDERAEAYAARVSSGRAQVAFFVVPSGVAFLAIGDALVALLFQGGRFSAEDTRTVWIVLAGGAVGLLATTTARLYASAFYAMRDTRTPLRFAAVRVTLTGVLGALAAFPLRAPLAALAARAGLAIPGDAAATVGALGLTASAGVAGWVELWLLRRALERKLGRTTRTSAAPFARVIAAALLAALAGRAVLAVVRMPDRPLVVAALGTAAFGAAYLGAALALRVPQAQGLVRRMARPLRRG